MKTISLLKAALSQDMNIFKYTTKRNSSTITKIMFPIIFFGIVCFSIGTYANFLAKELSSYHQTNFLLVLFIAIVTVLTIMKVYTNPKEFSLMLKTMIYYFLFPSKNLKSYS